jgi:hypothetical protein
LLILILEKILRTIRVFEAIDAPPVSVVPEIVDLSSYLERQTHLPGCAQVSRIYLDAIAIIRAKFLWTANSVLHLADVVRSARRILARNFLLRLTATEFESPEFTETKFDDHMACEGVTSPHDPPPFSDHGPNILETEEEDGEMIPPQRMFDTDISADQDAVYSQRLLHFEASTDLREISNQFRLNMTEHDKIIGSFQNFTAVTPTDLLLKPIPKKSTSTGSIARS